MVHLLLTDEPPSPCDSSSPGDRRAESVVNSSNDHSSPGTGGPLRVSTDASIIYNNLERITPRSQKKPKNCKPVCEKVTNQPEESHKSPRDSPPCKSSSCHPSNHEAVDHNNATLADQSMYHLYQNTPPRLMPSNVSAVTAPVNGIGGTIGGTSAGVGACCSSSSNLQSANESSSNLFGAPDAHATVPVPLSVSCPMSTLEFLPLCDLLFNVISLAGYFCDIVFDLVTIYSLYTSNEDHEYQWFVPMLLLVICSSLISQYLSFKWYIRWRINEDGSVGVTGQRTQERGLHEDTNLPCAHQLACLGSSCVNGIKADQSSGEHEARCFLVILINNWIPTPSNVVILVTHVLQAGVLWRYFRLFVPVNLHTVKYEVRDLCMLRMVHGFCEAAPMLLIQVYLILQKSYPEEVTDLNFISAGLSLFTLSWALASFSKNARRHLINRLIYSWPGVILQFCWRVLMISSRVMALTVCAAIYHEFVFAVILLHWFCMLLWLLSPGNLFEGERIPFTKRLFYSIFVAWVYIFCYINLYEDESRHKMIAFYSMMLTENILLLLVSFMNLTGPTPWYYESCIATVLGGFAFGLLAMALYYRVFHIRFVKQTFGCNLEYLTVTESTAGYNSDEGSNSNHLHSSQLPCDQMHPSSELHQCSILEASGLSIPGAPALGASTASVLAASPANAATVTTGTPGCTLAAASDASTFKNHPSSNYGHQVRVVPGIPGVFNCRLSSALKRKKKKPSTFVPPPPPAQPLRSFNSSANVTSVTSNANLIALVTQNRKVRSKASKSMLTSGNSNAASNRQQQQQQQHQQQQPHNHHYEEVV